MVSAATALSTMDFSLLPIDADAVDSPPKAWKRAERLKSPSPLKAQMWSNSTEHGPEKVIATQRKLYDESTVVPSMRYDFLFLLYFLFYCKSLRVTSVVVAFLISLTLVFCGLSRALKNLKRSLSKINVI